jgi:pimeloyl-ACP methyl ester carboxylesterase
MTGGCSTISSQLITSLVFAKICRVAARNQASFEWIHHEHVARKYGVTYDQLSTIGDIHKTLNHSKGQLSPIQQAAMNLADEMTTNVKVSDETFATLKAELAKADKGDEAVVNQKMTEAVSTVAVYNMVSRFLVALDVDDHSNVPCPVPGLEGVSSESAPLGFPYTPFNYSHGLVQVSKNVNLATKIHFNSMQSPWIVFVNSLMTNLTMWDAILPSFTPHFNVITYDQRGHGKSSTPPSGCTLDELADDIAAIQAGLGVEKLHAVVGVSQGGATALNFAIRHHDKVDKVVACDTQAVSPEANIKAWDERIDMAQKQGMSALANVTVPRWFGPGSAASDSVRSKTVQLVASTSTEGFEKAARSLQGYDLVSKGLKNVLEGSKTLLVAGSADGKLPEALQGLAKETGVDFVAIDSAGHLPMCDQPKAFTDKVLPWLLSK